MQVSCPSCQKQLRIPDSAAGKRVKCPTCNEIFRADDNADDGIKSDPVSPPPLPVKRERRPDPDEEERGATRRRSGRAEDDEDEDERRPARRRRRDEDADVDDEPPAPRARRRDEDDLDEDDERPRSRRRREEDEDDDIDDRPRRTKKKSAGRGKAAAVFFIIAGSTAFLAVAIDTGIALYASALLPAPPAGPGNNAAAFRAGQMVGIFGCGIVVLIGAISQFMAFSSLRSFRGKGRVVSAIVFGFIFGAIFGFRGVINFSLMGRVLPALKTVMYFDVMFSLVASIANFVAAILGIVALNNATVSKKFRRG